MTKISIIIPCYNECGTISKIIDKIILNSKFKNEIIVIDDFSNDGSREILQKELNTKISKIKIMERGIVLEKELKKQQGTL